MIDPVSQKDPPQKTAEEKLFFRGSFEYNKTTEAK